MISQIRRLSLGPRLWIGFGIVLVLLAGIATLGVLSLRSLGSEVQTLADREVPAVEAASGLEATLAEVGNEVADHLYVSSGNLEAQDELAADIEKKLAKADEHVATLSGSLHGERLATFEEEVAPKVASFEEEVTQTIAISRRETVQGAASRTESRGLYTGEIQPHVHELEDELGTLSHAVALDSHDAAAAAVSSSQRSSFLMIGFGVLGIVLGALAAVAIVRSVVGPLADLRTRLDKVAEGDLTQRGDESGSDELSAVARAFNNTVSGLAALVGQVIGSAERLRGASQQLGEAAERSGVAAQEIAATIDQVATGATEQATAGQDIAEAFSEIDAAVSDVAQNGAAASEAAGSADETAQLGAEAVDRASSAMADVNESVKSVGEVVNALGEKGGEIGSIVDTISRISEQTNLLALNAAIEAARAGEAGRGFAVVAEEVRQLAEESGDAAGSIARLIADIQGQTTRAVEAMSEGRTAVDGTVARMDETTAAFGSIRSEVARVVAEVSAVSSAADRARERAIGANDQVAAVAAAGEENAAAAEEVASASEESSSSAQRAAATAQELAASAEELVAGVSRFQV
jgi:methyl-accepting chemotaxis protein